MKIQADIISGVYQVEDFDVGVESLTPEDFYYALPKVGEDEVVATELEEGSFFAEKIEQEYGIH